LFSSHLLHEVQATVDDIVVINRGQLIARTTMSDLGLGRGTTKVRVADPERAVRALAGLGAPVEVVTDEQGRYLRVHSGDVGSVGAALFGAGVVVSELMGERRDLEQEFFSMLEAPL
jgi:ABC-2 type transport system ATP-binding protein